MIKTALLSILSIHFASAVKPWEAEPGNFPSTDEWNKIHQSMLTKTQQHKNDIKAIFIGASITNFWQTDGSEFWNSYYAKNGAADYGVNGDTTSNVLWRIQNHEFDGLNPKVIVVDTSAAINNIIHITNPGSSADLAQGVNEIIKELKAKFPQAKLIDVAIAPMNDDKQRAGAKDINEIIKKNANGETEFFIDIWSAVVDSNGKAKAGLLRDGLHFSTAGYKVWDDLMRPIYQKLIQ